MQRELVTRYPSEADKCFKIVQLTEAGRQLLQHIQPAVDGVQKVIVSPLNEQEVQTLVSLLQKIAEGNNAYNRAPKKIAS